MSHSEASLRDRLGALLPGPAVLDRKRMPDPEDQLASVQTTIAQTLESDQDAPYALLRLTVQRLRARRAAATAQLDTTRAAVLQSQQETPVGSSRRLAELGASLSNLAQAATYGRSTAIAQVQARSRSFAATMRMPDGSVELAPTAVDGKQVLYGALAALGQELAEIQEVLPRVVGFFESYAALDVSSTVVLRQAQQAASVLRDRVLAGQETSAGTAVDALLLSGLLAQTAVRLDVARAKWTGTVAAGAGVPAVLYGSPLPLAGAAAAQAASVTVDSTVFAVVQAPAGVPPVLRLAGCTAFFGRAEVATLATAAGAGPYTAVLKGRVVPGSVRVTATTGTYVDDGAGAWPVGTVGAIDYVTGVLAITLPGAPTAGSAIMIAYQYNPLADFQYRDATGLNPLSFRTFEIFSGNTLVTGDVAATAATDGASLAALLDAVVTGAALAVSHSDGVLSTAAETAFGSGARLMWPMRPLAVINALPFAPTWSTPPTTVNGALGLVLAADGRAFGRDMALSDVTNSAPNNLTVDTERLSLTTDQTCVVLLAAPTLCTATADVVAAIAVGDVVSVRAPQATVHRVAAKLSPTTFTVAPALPFALAAAPSTLETEQTVVYSVSRDRLRLTSRSTAAGSRLLVTTPALGLTGSSLGTWAAYTLSAAPELAYSLRPGDRVLVGAADVGSVQAVTGAQAIDVAVPGAAMTTLSVYSRGVRAYPGMRDALCVLATDEFDLSPAWVYACSGAGKDAWDSTEQTLLDFLAALEAALLLYDAAEVRFVSRLFAWLSEERLGRLATRLLDLDLYSVFSGDVLLLSAAGASESLLAEMADTLAPDGEVGLVSQTTDTAQDWYARSHREGV